jgi:hypothetical protein
MASRRTLQRVGARACAAAWILAVGVSAAAGIYGSARALRATAGTAWGEHATSDALLANVAGPAAPEPLRSFLASLPAGHSVLVTADPADPRFAQTLFVLSQIALPRVVAGVACPTTGAPSAFTPLPPDAMVGAVADLTLQHASGQPTLTWRRVPAAGAATWSTHCPSPARSSS